MPQLFNKVVIVGVGLIGSSIGMNLIKKRLAKEVIGIGRHRANLQEAVRRKAIHRFVGVQHFEPLQWELTHNDLVILATPVQEIVRTLNVISKKPLVIDVGSTKSSIVRAAEKKRVRLIGTHPIAGTEKSGAQGGEINLFQNRISILTPSRFARKEDFRKIARLWRLLGSETVLMSATHHDRLLSVVSHLPHVVAYSLVPAVMRLASQKEIHRFALGGLKGTTRIAQSPPEMWRDIFLENRTFILKGLKVYISELERLKSYLSRRDSKKILEYLKRSQKLRLDLA